MQIIRFPDFSDAVSILARPQADTLGRQAQVAGMLAAVKAEGDVAVRRFAAQFDGAAPDRFEVPASDFEKAERVLPKSLKNAIRQAYLNIKTFHATQQEQPQVVETMPGVRCWRKSVPIERIGLYIPGGSAPLFSTVLMLGVPAQIAACADIILCTPPGPDGAVHPAILFAAQCCGIQRVFKVGGVQAIGAMAYGTEMVPQVWKIFGPGNPWVTTAKQLVSLEGTAIDLPAGPSEVAVLADAGANPAFVAADLLSQAEHGADSQVLLVTDSEDLIPAVHAALETQLAELPRRDIAALALAHSRVLLVSNLTEGMRWINAYAPEHLILQVNDFESVASKVINAGSVFMGPYTPESAGDYASGTNHTLPTGGYARAFGGVSLDSFVKKITFQQITPEGLQTLGPVVTEMAEAEGLRAHAQAIRVRLNATLYP
ncbi:MAG: histidinol dehydrogenase [Bacteroidota bacterium]